MTNRKMAYLGAGLLSALLVGLAVSPVGARTVGWLYGEALRIADPIRGGTPDVTLAAGGAYIQGTLEVDSTVRFDGAVTQNAALTAQGTTIGVSSGTNSLATLRLRGVYTTAQLDALSASVGDIVYNFTKNDLCRSSATTTALPGAWVRISSTNPDGTMITCHTTTP